LLKTYLGMPQKEPEALGWDWIVLECYKSN